MSEQASPRPQNPAAPSPAQTTVPATGAEPAVDRYLATVRQFKLRRLYGLLVLSGMLLIPLIIIYVKGWWRLTGSGSVGSGWVFVGIGVVIAAVGAVAIDLLYRKEL
ncbi:MAG TPA: hypothetical protein VGD53_35530 [Actinoallomurus sp.]|jgi:hypothetical protein